MTIPNWLLMNVLVVEAGALLLAWAVILAHGVRGARKRAREPQLKAARDAVVRGILKGEMTEAGRARLERLSRSERVRLFHQVAPNLRGRERDWLGELAEELGLVAYGHDLCRSRFWWRRLRGARLLTLAGGAGDAVLELANDPHPLVRSQVAEWCGANPSEQSVATLIGMLGDPSHASRFTVQDALVRIGGESVEPLKRALLEIPIEGTGEADRNGKAAVAGLVVARGVGDSRLAPALVRFAGHPLAVVRREAYGAMGAAGGQEVADRLVEGLDDPDPQARAAAAGALGELGHWPAAPKLVNALEDRSWDVRLAAGRGLMRLGPPGELLLRRTLGSDNLFAADMARHAMDTAGVLTRFGGV